MEDRGVLPGRESANRSPRKIGLENNQRKPTGETPHYCFHCGLPQPCSCAYKATGEDPRSPAQVDTSSDKSTPKPFR